MIKKLMIGVLIALAFILITKKCHAAAVEVVEFNTTYKKATPNPDIYGMGLQLDLLKVGYWDSSLVSSQLSGQERNVLLNTGLGVRLFSWLDMGVWHQSNSTNLPNGNGIELDIIFYSRDNCRKPLF